MTYSVRSEASRAVIALDGVDRVAFNEDGSMELLTPAPNPTGNDVPTAGQLPDVTLVAAAAQSASGTSVDFTGIPVWAKRIKVLVAGLSSNGTSPFQLQIGTASGVETTGYESSYNVINSSVASGTHSNGIKLEAAVPAAAGKFTAIAELCKLQGNLWVFEGKLYRSDASGSGHSCGSKSLEGVLDRIRLTTVNGTDTFDAGTVNIMWE